MGIETEYGLFIEGRGPHDQVGDSSSFVASYPDPGFVGWDYRFESPRSDLRGFRLESLLVDPADAQFDVGAQPNRPASESRADRQLLNGARFYNDHGHPEYSTPECANLDDLVRHDMAGHIALRRAKAAFESKTDLSCKVYKNNTDFHGASYGTHENYLCSRSVPVDDLMQALVPMLVARQIVCGAGKVGSEQGDWCDFQLSQRADFFVELMSADTLYRRPIFNTRDEPHADPARWIRCHVIAGDANFLPTSTRLKAGLGLIAVRLAEIGEAPCIRFKDPISAAKSISRDMSHEFRIPLANGDVCTAYDVLDAYLDAANANLISPEITEFCALARETIAKLKSGWRNVSAIVDWAAKRALIEDFGLAEGATWRDPLAQSLDLAYCDLDEESGLCYGLREMGLVEAFEEDEALLSAPPSNTRAFARHVAMSRLPQEILSMTWSTITFRNGQELYLPPNSTAWSEPPANMNVESFGAWCKVNEQ